MGGRAEADGRRVYSILGAFWRAVEGATAAGRLSVLQVWSRRDLGASEALRRVYRRRCRVHVRAGEGRCWVCEASGRRVWHHIIQLQHGGTNARRNQVAICQACHAQVHPHLRALDGDEALYRVASTAARPAFDVAPRLIKK